MILVTTAGKVGSEAVLLLRQRQVPVRVLVRTPDKATALAEAGAEIAAGDLDAPASIDAAMAGITTVVLVSPGAPAQELAVIGSAARAGAGHVIKVTSNASADSPIARRRWQAEIEAGLASSGLAHTLLRSNAYMQNVLALAPAIAKTSGFGSSAGKGRVGMIDARDVAAVAAEIAASPAAHAGKTYWLTGPELISNSDVAAVLSKLLGRRITYRELSFEDDKEAMIRAGVPAPIAEMNAQAFSMIADGDAEWVTEDVPSLAGLAGAFFRAVRHRLRRRILVRSATLAQPQADVPDDRGGDDRAHPEQPGQAGPDRGDRGGGFLAGLADPRVDPAQVLGELGGELPAGRVHRPRRCDRLQEPGGLACGDLPGDAAGHQLAQHLVQPAGHLGAHPAQVPVTLGPDLEHRGVIIPPGLPDLGGAQRGDRHRAGIVGIVLVHVPGRQQPHPGGQLGRHVQHPLTRGQQLPGQQMTQPAGAFHRPGPLGPRPRPLQQPLGLDSRGAHPQLA